MWGFLILLCLLYGRLFQARVCDVALVCFVSVCWVYWWFGLILFCWWLWCGFWVWLVVALVDSVVLLGDGWVWFRQLELVCRLDVGCCGGGCRLAV